VRRGSGRRSATEEEAGCEGGIEGGRKCEFYGEKKVEREKGVWTTRQGRTGLQEDMINSILLGSEG